MHYFKSVHCPGHEFGLEACEEKLMRRGWYHGGGFNYPPDGEEQEEWDSWCDCYMRIAARGGDALQRYIDRVNDLFDNAEARR